MLPEDDKQLCRRCGYPVRLFRDNYDIFEQMHFVCFHYEFEHRSNVPGNDPDEDCGLPNCPSGPAARHREQLVAVVAGLVADCSDGVPASWENRTLPRYLEALAARLKDTGGNHTIAGASTKWSGWEVVADAMRAATIYE